MLQSDLLQLIRNGENSGVEFKRDGATTEDVAKEVAALLNQRGGYVLLGVEDDGTVTGLVEAPANREHWVMNLGRDSIQPAIIPYWETVEWEPGRVVGVIRLPDEAPDKPYKARRRGAWVTFVRAGSTSREATREEESRLYQTSGMVRYDIRPVPGATLGDLDRRRLEDYFRRIHGTVDGSLPQDDDSWARLLLNTELMVEQAAGGVPTIACMLLFGLAPHRFLPQSGAVCVAFPGTEKTYESVAEEHITGPMVSLWNDAGSDLIERGVIDRVLDFLQRHNPMTSGLVGGVRTDIRRWPEPALREAVVNAFAHRDWSIHGTEVEVAVYVDRIEVVSPGALPNTITVERMRTGTRYARNQLVRDILQDYRYVDARGLGVPRKIVASMRAHNATDPVLIADEHRFTVGLLAY